MFTAVIDSSVLRNRLGELHDVLIAHGREGDAALMVENEARLFLKQVITLTPPAGLGGAAKTVGEHAVSRDLNYLFSGVSQGMADTISGEFGTTGIDHWLTGKDGNKTHIQWQRLDPSGAGMPAFHAKNRDSRGRTYRLKRDKPGVWFSPYVTSQSALDAYRAKILSHVGRRKAAWAKSYAALGGKVQGWISRHLSGAKGQIWNDLGNKNRPSVTVSSHAPGVGQDEQIVRDAMRIRAQAIGRKMKGILSGYSADWKAGVKIAKQERRKVDE